MASLTDQEIDSLLAEPQIAVLCTADAGGTPEGTPVWFEYRGGFLYLLCHRDSKKARNLRSNPRVSLTVDTREPPYRGMVLRGRAALSGPDAALRRRLAARYLGPETGERYIEATRSMDDDDVLVTIEVTSRSSWDYSKGF